jgi:uncharacterized membrane protein YsdA (DUF1294 family)/cold shock CspA family protein
MRFEGKLVRWDDAKGFGFIESSQGGEPIFVHAKAFRTGGGRPGLGDALSFEVEVGPKGKRAKKVERLAIRRSPPRPRHERPVAWGLFSLGALAALVAAYGTAWKLWGISHVWALYFLGLSFIAAIAYAQDKSAARRGDWRASEQTLHVLGVLGGWPGALIMQKALRHKSSKNSFQAVFWICVVVNLVLFLALAHPKFRGLVPWSAV